MPLAPGVAIVTALEVAAITHEDGLAQWDDAVSGATLDNARAQATNFLIVDLKAAHAINPEKIANVPDLKIAAALCTAFIIYASRPQDDEEIARKTADLKKRYDDQIEKYRFESIDQGNERLRGDKGHARSYHLDQEPTFTRPVDNRRPTRLMGPYTKQKGQQ